MLGSRKLSIMVFADIAGYSAMMQTNEVNALAVLDRFKTVLEKSMQMQEGQIVQYYGDGALLAFDSALLSLQAVMNMQSQFIAQEVPVRIGMHLGDVLYKNGNAFGSGVNIASRIESLGIPGAILLSKTIRDQIKNKPELELTSLGDFHFKNIPEPQEVFAVANPGFVVPQPKQMQGKLQQPQGLQPSQVDPGAWEKYQMLEILDALEEKKCVLILGNYAFSKPSADGAPESESFLPDLLHQESQKWLKAKGGQEQLDFFTSAQSLIDRAGGQRMFIDLTRIQMKDLATKQLERFKKLSEIPFDLILSTYPFDLVHEVFEHNQIDHQYAYYSYVQETEALQPFSDTRPLLYNLFGSVKHKESMVISLDRLYQFIFGILGVHQLPKRIQDKVQQASHLVFLGFSFDDWYMKLLLRVLKVHEKDISYAHSPSASSLRQQNKQFFESNFKVTFLDKRIDEFVEGLHSICASENLLRQKTQKTLESSYEELQDMLEAYRLEEVLLHLDELLLTDGQQGELLKELSGYQQRFHKIEEWEDYNNFSRQELAKKWRQLRNKLSMFIDQVAEVIPV
ncbi:MAG: SIR2 family protein [Bacteroidota bacterium]